MHVRKRSNLEKKPKLVVPRKRQQQKGVTQFNCDHASVSWSVASAIQVNVVCNSPGVFNAEHFQQIAESTFSELLKL